MKKNLRSLVVAAVGAAASLSFSSCAYDPYYSSAGGSYSSGSGYGGGYGDGYGYGGSSFNTSLFVSTGDSRWGYDPYTYSYYDYRRRCYYDPYLNGYYPIGYRPAVVYGVPHPYGWRPGHGYCPPPRHVANITVTNYRNRESAYRNTNYGWARQVRQQSGGSGRDQNQWRNSSPQTPDRPSSGGYRPTFNQNQPNYNGRQFRNQPDNGGSQPSWRRTEQPNQAPQSRYNTPISTYSQPPKFSGQQPKFNENRIRPQTTSPQRQEFSGNGNSRREDSGAKPQYQSRERSSDKQDKQPNDGDRQGRGWR